MRYVVTETFPRFEAHAVLTPCQNINEKCFERCVPKPGSSLSSGEQTCMKQCMEKYMAAWNEVNSTYIRRIQQEIGNNTLSNV